MLEPGTVIELQLPGEQVRPCPGAHPGLMLPCWQLHLGATKPIATPESAHGPAVAICVLPAAGGAGGHGGALQQAGQQLHSGASKRGRCSVMQHSH